jgi:competence protein ComEA
MYEKVQRFNWVDGLLAVGLGLMTVGIGYNLKTKLADNTRVELIKAVQTPVVTQGVSNVTFDISGEVLKPGVYKLNKGGRVVEAMAMAGGMAANADREWVEKNINLARVVADGEKIYIPKINNQTPITNNQTNSNNQLPITKQVLGSGVININTANVGELDKLSGIGPAIAQRIIDYREKYGEFKDINEIKMVSGIGDKMFEKIKDQIGI